MAIVRLDRPPVNALELGILQEAASALDDLLATDVGAIVLTGTGACFSAGLDLKLVPEYDRAQQREMVARANLFLGKLYACPRPLVAAVNGHAIAGGLVAVLACDYRVGTRAPCRLGLTEARAGIPFPAAAMTIVQAELAPQVARVTTLVAQNVDPETAHARGVLDELQPAERVLPRALEVARDLADIPRDAYARIKRQLRAEAIARIEDVNARGTDPMLEGWLGSESAGAAAAVLRGEGGT